MDKLLKISRVEGEIKNADSLNVTVADLYQLINEGKPKAADRIRKLLPDLSTLDCHRIKATVLDMKKSGKITQFLQKEGQTKETPTKRDVRTSESKSSASRGERDAQESQKEAENITPDKTGNPNVYFASMESLKAKRRKPGSSFKRREALNKKGWAKDDKQMTIDKFLVPRRKKRVENNQLMLMT